MANSASRIYISAMETEVEGWPRFDPQASELLVKLSAAGYIVQWEKEFRGYETIERDIAASDALLAIVDRTWTSSTWMASEVTWANGDFGAMETSNPKMRPIPIFLYPVIEQRDYFPFNHINAVHLERNADQARNQILNLLPPHRAV